MFAVDIQIVHIKQIIHKKKWSSRYIFGVNNNKNVPRTQELYQQKTFWQNTTNLSSFLFLLGVFLGSIFSLFGLDLDVQAL